MLPTKPGTNPGFQNNLRTTLLDGAMAVRSRHTSLSLYRVPAARGREVNNRGPDGPCQSQRKRQQPREIAIGARTRWWHAAPLPRVGARVAAAASAAAGSSVASATVTPPAAAAAVATTAAAASAVSAAASSAVSASPAAAAPASALTCSRKVRQVQVDEREEEGRQRRADQPSRRTKSVVLSRC